MSGSSRQVAMNLVTNAAEALGDDEGRILVATEPRYYDAEVLARFQPKGDLPGGHYVRVTVSDTGSGMDPETQARIFDPFFTTKFTGRGLGLAAAERIVRGHHGAIYLESERGVGTTFTVLLPTTEAPERDDPPDEAPAPGRAAKRVLVVDDNAHLRRILGKLKRHAGFEVVATADGQEALDHVRADPNAVDCVLLDLSMPRLGGEETYRELRALRADLPVVLISGFTEKEVLSRFQGADIAGVLQKPAAAADLIATIRAATSPG
ncbi:response regulator [Planctomycetota bacterium]